MTTSIYDIDQVKRAAAGDWISVFQWAGIPAESLSGNHGPCPKCGGTDRFRLLDKDDGSLHCNQCFNERNGDGIAALQWWWGTSFPETVHRLAEYLGVEPTKKAGRKKKNANADPEANLKFIDWVDTFAFLFCNANPGISPEALRLACARMGYYRQKNTVIALPIYGEKLIKGGPVGWIIQDIGGGTLPRFDKSGKVVEQVKRKITYGSRPGVVGDRAAQALADPETKVVWKMEGVSDYLAMETCLLSEPREGHAVVTTASGAGEKWRNLPWLIKSIEGRELRIIHDCDRPGQKGADSILAETAQVCAAKNYVLPYPIKETHGEDFRDWLATGVQQPVARLEATFEKIEPSQAIPEPRRGADDGDEKPTQLQLVSLFLADRQVDGVPKYIRHGSIKDQQNYQHNGTVYVPANDEDTRRDLARLMEGLGMRPTSSTVASAHKLLEGETRAPGNVPDDAQVFWRSDPPKGWPENADPSTAIVTRSQIIVPQAGKLPSEWPVFLRDGRFFCKFAHDFDFPIVGGRLYFPDCPAYKNFLHQIFGGETDQITTLQRYFGYTLTNLTSQQKLVLLSGSAGSGKSLTAKTGRWIVGEHLTTSTSLMALTGPHGMASLVGKRLAVLADERRLSKQAASEVLPRILSVTGEDFVSVNRKFKDEYTTRLPTRLLIVSNETSPLLDEAEALTRRMILLRTRRSFVGTEDTNLEATLRAEIPGILAWAMVGLSEILNGVRLVSPDSTKNDLESIQEDSNPLSEFFADHLIDDKYGWIPCRDLHKAVREWANANELSVMERISSTRIGALLLNSKPQVMRERKMYAGKLSRGFSGIRLRPGQF